MEAETLNKRLSELRAEQGQPDPSESACTELRKLTAAASDDVAYDLSSLDAVHVKVAQEVASKRKHNEELRESVARRLRAKLEFPCSVASVVGSFRYGGGYVTSAFSVKTEKYEMTGWAPSANLALLFGTSSPRLMPGLGVHFLALPDANVNHHGSDAGQGSYVELAIDGMLKILTGAGWYVEPSGGLLMSFTTLDHADVHTARRPGIDTALELGWDKMLGESWALGAGVRVAYSHVFALQNGATPSATGNLFATTLELGIAGY